MKYGTLFTRTTLLSDVKMTEKCIEKRTNSELLTPQGILNELGLFLNEEQILH